MYSQQGSALLFVILISAALLFLGVSMLDFNSIDLQIAANHRESAQAQFLAEAGIESALSVLKQYDPFYTGDSNTTLEEGSFSVSVTALEPGNGSRLVTIASTGKAGRAREQVTLEFVSFPPAGGGINGAELGWYDEADGIIVPGIHAEAGGMVILGSEGMAVPLVLRQQEDEGNGQGDEVIEGWAYMGANQLFFINEPVSLLLEEDLEIGADTVVFHGSVMLCPQFGSLRFSHPAGGPVHVYLREQVLTLEHAVLIEAGVYRFPGGFELTGVSDPFDMLSYRVLPAVPGTMVWRGR